MMTPDYKATTASPFSPRSLESAVMTGAASAIIQRRDGYTYFRHKETGLVYALPFPTARALADYYDGFLFQQPASSGFHAMRQAVTRATAAIAKDLTLHYGAATGSLLDFGGGLGFYADGFSRYFGQVTLFDVDPQACIYAREAFPGRFEILEGQPGQPVPANQRYDVVFASHVVEHHVDLPAFFGTLRTLTKPGGIIVVATPNNDTWEYFARPNVVLHYLKRTVGRRVSKLPQACAALLSNSWLCCDPPRHIYALNPVSIRAIAEDSGLVVHAVFTEYAWSSRYALVNDQVPQSSHGLVKRALQATINAYARVALPLLRGLDSRQTRGGNLVLIARSP